MTPEQKAEFKTLDMYLVSQAYWWSEVGEVEIKGSKLLYVENGTSHSGVQCANLSNADKIRDKCQQIANLFREIEKLNKP